MLICLTDLVMTLRRLVQAKVAVAVGFGGIVGWAIHVVWVYSGCCRGWWCWAMYCQQPLVWV